MRWWPSTSNRNAAAPNMCTVHSRGLAIGLAAGLIAHAALGQTNDLTIGAGPEATASDAYRVSAFTIQGGHAGAVALPLRVGDLWTPEKQSEVLQAIRKAFEDDPMQTYLFNQAGEIGVFYVEAREEKDEATHTIKITFHPIQV